MEINHHRLLPGHKFQLRADCDNGRQFVRLFRSCWKQVPYASRRAILAYWKSSEFPYHPSFEFSDMWNSEACFAQVRNGVELRFSATAFAVFPDKTARWVVAHELAHVYQKALGKAPGGHSEDENEADANRIAEGWGFDKTPFFMLGVLQHKLSFEDACKRIIELRLDYRLRVH
jgi:hypothetical protein